MSPQAIPIQLEKARLRIKHQKEQIWGLERSIIKLRAEVEQAHIDRRRAQQFYNHSKMRVERMLRQERTA